MKLDYRLDQKALCNALDWCRDKFPVKDEWVGNDLLIYFPYHTESKGFVKITPGTSDWTITVDMEFKDEFESAL